jgi:hypothetical protein
LTREDPGHHAHSRLTAAHLTFGLEEEVFVCAGTAPTMESLYYLARLLWRNPRVYYRHSDSNFARGRDVRRGLMSGVEISTIRQHTPQAAVADLRRCRTDLARACGRSGALLVPVGHLLDRDTPTNVCGLHIHIGLPAWARESGYRRLAPFLPLLALLTASSPCRSGEPFGPSYRMVAGYATGPLRHDNRYRFQDLIISRRLGTLEARLFDPVWDLSRIEHLLRAMRAILLHAPDQPIDYASYAALRELTARRGYGEEFKPLYESLTRCLNEAGEDPVPEELFANTVSRQILETWRQHGLAATYYALHRGYLGHGYEVSDHAPAVKRYSLLLAAGGVVGYYVVRLPYKLSKVLRESGKEKVVDGRGR